MSDTGTRKPFERRSEVAPLMLRLSEVALLLRLHPNTVRAWADKGLLTAYRLGRRGDRRFRRDEVMELLSAGNMAPPQQR